MSNELRPHIESVRIERKWADAWVGMFWKSGLRVCGSYDVVRRIDVWLCLVPFFPIHLVAWSGPFHNPNVPRSYRQNRTSATQDVKENATND